MGAVVDAGADVLDSVGSFAGDLIQGAGDIVTAVVDNVVAPVADTVANTIEAAMQDPIGTAIKVGTAIVAPELLPFVNFGVSVANGQSLESALAGSALSYVGGQVAQGVGGGIAQATGSQAIGNVAGGVAGAAVTGRDPLTALVSGGFSQALPYVTSEIPGYADMSPVMQRAASSAIITTLMGGDPTQGLINQAISAGINAAKSEYNTPSSSGGLANSESPNDYPQGGFYSQWQTVGNDRIMVYDDGTAIGMNENGDGYSLNENDVNSLIQNGMLNTVNSGYGAAIGSLPNASSNAGTSSGIKFSGGLSSATSPYGGSSGNFTRSLSAAGGLANTLLGPDASGSNGSVQQTIQPTKSLADIEREKLAAAKGSHLFTGNIGSAYKLQDINQSFAGLDPDLAKLLKERSSDVDPISDTLDTPQNVTISQPAFARGGQVVGLGGLAHGGEAAKYHPEAPKGHYPEFISGKSDQYARGRGDGQSDDIPSMLGEGDYVMDADVVSALGNGSSKGGAEALQKMRLKVGGLPTTPKKYIPALIADGEVVLPAAVVAKIGNGNNKLGAQKLDKMREAVRTHNRSAPTTKIPFKAKSPLDYLKMAQRG